ncbi:hypothetical protein E4T39_06866 [Aureobasidium subglaciale]|nr:hypothetical protein E4T39_06866 [Aureobasidium subglaciale]
MAHRHCLIDDFGPAQSPHCQDGFDFTLLFEQSILSIGPSALLLLVYPVRLFQLHSRSKPVARPGVLAWIKLTIIAILGCLKFSLLVLNALSVSPHTLASTPAAILGTLDCFALAHLSFFEHTRSFQPSSVLNLYLSFSSVFDAAQVRTLWLLPTDHTLATVSTATLVSKVSLLLLEATEKRSLLRPPYKTIAIESTSGIGNRSIFLWLNPLIWQGCHKLLAFDDLQRIDDTLGSRALQSRFYQHWTRSRCMLKWQVTSAG